MSTPFTGSAFYLESVTQYALATVRVRYTQDPLAANPTGPNDALNPANYTLTGPAYNAIVSVGAVFGDPQSVDVFMAQPLAPGIWTLTVAANVEMWDLTTITTPRVMNFVAAALTQPEPVNPGAVNDSAADLLRKHLNSALVGDGWDAVIQAMATGDDANVQLAESAFDQLFKSTATGLYLDRKSGDDGIIRPPELGMPDSLFSQYSIRATTGKLVENAILDILEVFYGTDSLRAHCTSALFQPYVFQAGNDLTVLLDEQEAVTITFAATDFAVAGAATAAEVAAAITRGFRLNGLNAYAIALKDPVSGLTGVRIYSGSLGLASAVRVLGGKAQFTLQFPTYLSVFSGLPTWTLTFNAVTNTLRLTPSGSVDLSQIRVGDYVCIYGTEFSAGNIGTYTITNVYYAYSPGLTQYVEVVDATGFAQVVTQLSTGSLTFFRPTRSTPYTDPARAVIVAWPGDGLDVAIPATSQAVGRGPMEGAYLYQQVGVNATSVKRVNTTVTVVAPSHGLNVNDDFFLDGAHSTYALPTTVSGTPPTLDASLVSIWGATTDSVGRRRHAAVLLQDGRAFVIGGVNPSNTVIATTSLFTLTGPVTLGTGEQQYTGNWATGTAAPVGMAGHAATVVASGKVVVSGGQTSKVYVYTPAPPAGAGSWITGPNLADERDDHKSALIGSGTNAGRVLIAGGTNGGGTPLSSCDVYDPVANTVAATGAMAVARAFYSMITLANGKIMVVGGSNTIALTTALNSVEIFDPATNTWSTTGSMSWGRIRPATALLPDGRVIVAGGRGYEASQGGSVSPLKTCEIYDPSSGRWSKGPDMSAPHYWFDLITVGTKIYACGGSDLAGAPYTELTEYLDTSVLRWRHSLATITTARTDVVSVLVGGAVILGTGGTPDDGSASNTTDYVLVPASESVSAKLDGLWRVASVIDANTFTFTTPDSGYYLSTTGTVTAVKAQSATAGDPGPYVYDPNAGGVTSEASAISTQLSAGHQYAYVDVADATQFPDAPGWLVFGFGYSYQVGPVQYLGRLSATRIALDFTFKFPVTVPAGALAAVLVQKGPWVPAAPQSVGSFYLTGSAAGRVAAETAVEDAVATGVPVSITVEYPGDRGLGGEGLPVHGVPRISDRVEVWAGDEVDAEVAAARSD